MTAKYGFVYCHSQHFSVIINFRFSMQILLVDKKITNPKDMFRVLDSAVKEKFQLLIIAEDFEPEALALLIRNKLKGVMKAAAIKAPSFGDRKSDYLNDIAALTGGSS